MLRSIRLTHVSLFITTNGDIYVDNDHLQDELYTWSRNLTNSDAFRNFISKCTHLFIGNNTSLYCSIDRENQVVKFLTINMISIWKSLLPAIQVKDQRHIYSTIRTEFLSVSILICMWLIVAIIEFSYFGRGEINGTTVAGNNASGIDGLQYPTGVILDVYDYLYIADCNNHRIIKSAPNGFRCIAGCSGHGGSASDQLFHPHALWFDNGDNLFVLDKMNRRIQKFLLSETSNGMFDIYSIFSKINYCNHPNLF